MPDRKQVKSEYDHIAQGRSVKDGIYGFVNALQRVASGYHFTEPDTVGLAKSWQKRLLEMDLESLVVPQANAAEEAGKLIFSTCQGYGQRRTLPND